MADHQKRVRKIVSQKQSHIPENSVMFEKVVPALLVGLGVLTVVLILFAAGVLLGVVTF